MNCQICNQPFMIYPKIYRCCNGLKCDACIHKYEEIEDTQKICLSCTKSTAIKFENHPEVLCTDENYHGKQLYKCNIHHIPSSMVCEDCSINICSKCIKEHTNKDHSIGDIDSFLKNLSLREKDCQEHIAEVKKVISYHAEFSKLKKEALQQDLEDIYKRKLDHLNSCKQEALKEIEKLFNGEAKDEFSRILKEIQLTIEFYDGLKKEEEKFEKRIELRNFLDSLDFKKLNFLTNPNISKVHLDKLKLIHIVERFDPDPFLIKQDNFESEIDFENRPLEFVKSHFPDSIKEFYDIENVEGFVRRVLKLSLDLSYLKETGYDRWTSFFLESQNLNIFEKINRAITKNYVYPFLPVASVIKEIELLFSKDFDDEEICKTIESLKFFSNINHLRLKFEEEDPRDLTRVYMLIGYSLKNFRRLRSFHLEVQSKAGIALEAKKILFCELKTFSRNFERLTISDFEKIENKKFLDEILLTCEKSKLDYLSLTTVDLEIPAQLVKFNCLVCFTLTLKTSLTQKFLDDLAKFLSVTSLIVEFNFHYILNLNDDTPVLSFENIFIELAEKTIIKEISCSPLEFSRTDASYFCQYFSRNLFAKLLEKRLRKLNMSFQYVAEEELVDLSLLELDVFEEFEEFSWKGNVSQLRSNLNYLTKLMKKSKKLSKFLIDLEINNGHNLGIFVSQILDSELNCDQIYRIKFPKHTAKREYEDTFIKRLEKRAVLTKFDDVKNFRVLEVKIN